MEPQIIYRYGQPTKLDHAPMGTECRIKKDFFFELYIQSSTKEDDPLWECLGTFDEDSYQWYKHNNSQLP